MSHDSTGEARHLPAIRTTPSMPPSSSTPSDTPAPEPLPIEAYPTVPRVPVTHRLQPAPATRRLRPARRARRRAVALLASGVVALLVAGMGVYAYLSYQAPAHAADQLCGALVAEHYGDAYAGMTSAGRGNMSASQFGQAMASLDTSLGRVTSCRRASSGGYTFHLGMGSAAVALQVRRTGGTDAGSAPYSGSLVLDDTREGWRVASVPGALLGADPGALATVDAYCAALQTADAPKLYSLLAPSARSGLSAQDYTTFQQLRATLDGSTSACALTGVHYQSSGAPSDVATVAITRAKLGATKGTVTLRLDSGAWKVVALDRAVEGTDLGALLTAEHFCANLAAGKYGDAVSQFAPNFVASASAAALSGLLAGSGTGIAYTGCHPNLTSVAVTGPSATLSENTTFRITSSGVQFTDPVTLHFTLSGGAWQISGLDPAGTLGG